MKTRAGLMSALMIAAAWSTATTADTAMQKYELDLQRCSDAMPLPDGTTQCALTPFMVECLNEYVVGEYHISGSYQEFATPSGTAHIRDNWKVISTLVGVDTGRVWYAVGVSPASANFGEGETFHSSGTLTYKPLADGPTWQEQFVYKTIRNANGEIVVNSEESRYKCLGTGR